MSKASEHTPRLVQSHHVYHLVHGAHPVGRFNAWLALRITTKVGTMWCAYVFAILGGVSLYGALSNNVALVLIAGGISSYFIQLVLLPVIMVGQNVQQAASDARAEADHETLSALHAMTSRIDQLQAQQLEILQELRHRG